MRKRMLRSFLFSVLAALMAVPVAPSAFAQAPTQIKVGTGLGVDFLPAYVARDEGIFAKHGLDVTLVFEPNPSVVPALLVSDSLQISYSTPPNILIAVDGGLDLVAIVGAARLVKSNPKTSLVTRPGLTVTRAADLKGRKIGVPGFGSSMDMFLRKWIIDDHVAINDVSIVEAAMPQMGDLLKSGQLDAATTLEPIRSRIIASGQGVASVDFFSAVNPDMLGSFWMSTRDWANGHRAAVEAFRASIAEGVAFIQANVDAAHAAEQKDSGFVDPTALPSYAIAVDPNDFAYIEKVALELGVTKHPVDATKLIFK